ncbi:MAG: hypothetical protein LBP92_02865 [Deltaproteobacteria bacterium]|jgi:hypothetical protein|nr:hypothetical protein [Deltaproteobacteria bacterium]
MKFNNIFLRQIHPSFSKNKEITSQAFLPSPKDQGMLSVYDGTITTPFDSYRHYTQFYHLESIGVWGVDNSEISQIGLTSFPEPLEESPAHAVIDFNSAPPKKWRQLARNLKFFALNRGCLFSPAF